MRRHWTWLASLDLGFSDAVGDIDVGTQAALQDAAMHAATALAMHMLCGVRVSALCGPSAPLRLHFAAVKLHQVRSISRAATLESLERISGPLGRLHVCCTWSCSVCTTDPASACLILLSPCRGKKHLTERSGGP
jgi:hypothetical protein